MNVLPNTSSSGGTNDFGVVVLVMDSALGLISCVLAVGAAFAIMLYSRDSARYPDGCKHDREADDANRGANWHSIVIGRGQLTFRQ